MCSSWRALIEQEASLITLEINFPLRNKIPPIRCLTLVPEPGSLLSLNQMCTSSTKCREHRWLLDLLVTIAPSSSFLQVWNTSCAAQFRHQPKYFTKRRAGKLHERRRESDTRVHNVATLHCIRIELEEKIPDVKVAAQYEGQTETNDHCTHEKRWCSPDNLELARG